MCKMIQSISIDDLLLLPQPVPLADVRTPAEFEHGHIPGAFNLPLFSNEERVKVGTTYKQVGREAAILLGFDLTGSKWSGFIQHALLEAPAKKIAVHCWRGGMRSAAMAWALDLYGFDVYLLAGGYKRYRQWVLQQFEKTYRMQVLGGMTGSGKTAILQQLSSMGEQVIDLEKLARHRGSSYGSLNKLIQPSQEQFENNLADELVSYNTQHRIWVEDESAFIGKLIVPRAFWNQMSYADLLDIQVPIAQRIETLVEEYGQLDKDFLISCTERIGKRLGPDQTKQAIIAIQENRMADFIGIILVYYDKTYRKSLAKRNAVLTRNVELENADPIVNAKQLLSFMEQHLNLFNN